MNNPFSSQVSSRIQLALMVLVMLCVWCGLLPAIGRTRVVKQWIEPLRQQGINPAALYYTEVFDDSAQR